MSSINKSLPSSSSLYYIGTMSGTSADGLDIVIAQVDDKNHIELIHSYFCKYPLNLSQRIKQLQMIDSQKLFRLYQDDLNKLDQELSVFFAENIHRCLSEANINKKQIIAIGNHGQTVLHQPNADPAFSLQLCDAQKLATACSIPVIADFRRADIEQGGQGAPLMPTFHAAIFEHHTPCAVVNIGGISNTSLLSKNTLLGFDNGPGNTLMDAWIAKHQGFGFDKNGDWARSGLVHDKLLTKLLSDEYFSLNIPKSTGQDLFNLEWLESKLSSFGKIPANNIQSTLCDLTAKSILNDIEAYNNDVEKIFICGGGAKNSFLVERLQHYAGEARTVKTTNELGMDTDWVEALGFAWLAFCHDHQIKGNSPSVTGAKKEVVLGQRFDPLN